MSDSYAEFLASKQDHGADSGFVPLFMPSFLFDFQEYLVDWAVRKGRAAIFADCGMGKTPMQLVWAENVIRKTNRPVLILTPLAVSAQTLQEAEKFGIGARRAGAVNGDGPVIEVTNYERLHHFEPTNYAGVVCDESSILKNYDGTRRAEITEFMRQAPYRLLCTATAAPNDWIELGTSSEALGYLGHMDMITRFFTNRGRSLTWKRFGRFNRGTAQGEYHLKPHAQQPFWRWVSSWARAARRPADLGFDDDGFILPPLKERHQEVRANRPPDGMLFDLPAVTWQEEREAVRRTIQERCETAAAKCREHKLNMVWCHLNDESTTLKRLIPEAIEIKGSDSDDAKEEAAHWFTQGAEERRALISKPRIFGFGMNFQHCAHMTYFPTHSYERYYQATRRLWRFGQERPVVSDLIYTDGGRRMMENLARKAKAADRMFDDLTRYMGRAMQIESHYEPLMVEVPTWMTRS